MLMKLAVVASLVVACLAEEAVRQKRSSGYEDEHDDRKYGGGGYGSDDGYGSDHGYGRPEKKHDYGHDKKDYYKSKCCHFIWSVVLE